MEYTALDFFVKYNTVRLDVSALRAPLKQQERAVIFTDLKLGGIPDFASFMLARVFTIKTERRKNGKVKTKKIWLGFVFVRNPQEYGLDAVWKLPGGRPKGNETPLATAVREFLEETNISVDAAECRFRGRWLAPSKDHWKCVFTVDIDEKRLSTMNSKHPGNEGEVPKFFRMDKLIRVVRLKKFMKTHYSNLIEMGLLLPGAEAEATVLAA